MQYSDYYNLRKPQMAETASVNDLNYNTDRIDAIMADNRQISVAMYVSGNTYNTGDLVGYENAQNRIHIYKCLEDNVTGSWDATKWDITTLADEVLEAKASGGTEVEANPTGTPTDTLETIGIDGVIYGVEGGGGGGGSSTLAGLTDVALTSPSQGQALVYDGTEWVNGKGGSDLVINAQIYSTEEKQIGVWIDGKPLYQKTINCGALPATAASKEIDLGVSIDDCPYIHGYARHATAGYIVAINDIVPTGVVNSIRAYVNRQTNKLYLSTGTTGMDAFTDCKITIRYTKTTDNPGSGSYQAYGLAPVIYSLEEREVGVWTDGKPLYQKTLVSSSGVDISISNTTWSNTNFDVSSLNIERIINGSGLSYDGSYQGGILYYVDNGYLYAQTARNSVGWVTYFTIQYTKTTDTPGSGTWTPQSVPAVHYSTDEQVVGTWVDGSTIYEKTLYAASGTINSSNSLSMGTITGIGRLISYEGSVYDSGDRRFYALPYEKNTAVEGIWVQCHVLPNNTLTPIVFTRQTPNYNLQDVYVTIRYIKSSS